MPMVTSHHIRRFFPGQMIWTYLMLFLLVALFGVPSAVNADVAKGKDALEMEDFTNAWRELLPLAEAGNAEAQILVGRMYNNGHGVNADLAKGAEYYKRAAAGGNARAQALLAFLYTAGRGVKKDHGKALHWYLLAADSGDAYAQLDVARIYRSGANVERDYVQAYKWYFIVSKNDEICDCLLDGKAMVAAKMSSQEIQQAEKLAVEWFQRRGR